MGYEMPFGKHKGTPLDKMETKSLEWYANLDDLREPFKGELAKELAKRRGGDNPNAERGYVGKGPVVRSKPSDQQVIDRAHDILAAGYAAIGTRPGGPEAKRWLEELMAGAQPADEVPF